MTDPASDPPSGDDYDLMPYRSMPYALSRPEHLAAVLRVFGIAAPDPEGARVLELGCASGGNLIPLAARFPQAQFLGIDLSRRQVADGQARIADLGLNNIEIRQGDIALYDPGEARFDYVICHGVYSWIPPDAQDGVMRIAGRALSPTGAAYVSYNVYPGWRMRSVIRDLCLLHAGSSPDPRVRVARARWALEQIAKLSDEKTPYGQLLRREAAQCAALPDSYILGEFLASFNAPCTFAEFATRAAGHGLSYLTETSLGASLPESISAETGALIRQIAGKDGVALEQYIDYFAGRQFRRSVLVRAAAMAGKARRLDHTSMRGLHVATPLQRLPDSDPETGAIVFAAKGQQVKVADPAGQRLHDALQAAWPASLPVDGLASILREAGFDIGDAQEAQLAALVLSYWQGGLAELLVTPRASGRARDTDRPIAAPHARAEAAAGQTWATSITHDPVPLNDVTRAAIIACDGSADLDALADVVAEATQRQRDSDLGSAPAAPARPTTDSLMQFLQALERGGLLIS